MDRSDASALADLQMHWDEAYVIGLDGDIWSARYRSSTDELRAHTSAELRELIRSDYAFRQKADLVTHGRSYHDEDEDEFDDADEFDDLRTTLGRGSCGSGPDGDQTDDDAAARQHAEHVNFAAIRGERMST